MVRLKALANRETYYDTTQFQFHYGTIKSYRETADDIKKPSFNSTMGRLKADVAHALENVDK